MSRKRQTDGAPPDAAHDPTQIGAVKEPPTSPNDEDGDARRPAMSWALNSDRTTRVEIAAWLNTFTTQGGEQFEQATFTVTRNYKTEEGWHKGGSWRTHDVPILQHLLAEAYAWALRRRTTVRANGEEGPFS